MRRWSAVVAAALLGIGALAPTAPTAEAAPPGDDAVVAFLVRGVGNGHGRGLSQWGAYGRAVSGVPGVFEWRDILNAYYGGTVLSTATKPDLRVELRGWSNQNTVTVMSAPAKAAWKGVETTASGAGFTALRAVETSANRFSIYGVTVGATCGNEAVPTVPMTVLTKGMTNNVAVEDMQRLLRYLGFDPQYIDGDFGNLTAAALAAFQADENLPVDGTRWDSDDWSAAQTRLSSNGGTLGFGAPIATNVLGPITFSTTVPADTSSPGEVLGLCESDGTITHYRGSLDVVSTSDGNRVVNQVDGELYLRGVLPKEVSASWGDAAEGLGMNALMAQAVAARSYAFSQSRWSHANTCDTSSCQVYGGAASRISATTANSVSLEFTNTTNAVNWTATRVRRWPADHPTRSNQIVSTEFSASNGPRTAGGTFPAVDDPYDDQPGNPNHRWTRIIDADELASRYGVSNAAQVRTEPDPNAPYDGIWDNRVNLGNGAVVTAWDFRNAFGLPAPGFELVPIRRSLTGAGSFAFIGDSVGRSITEINGQPLPTLTEGVFSSERFDSVDGRTTAAGVTAAQQLPMGTDLVVVELGYNDTPSTMTARIDALMTALRARDVDRVAWVNVSERRTSTNYATTNAAIAAAIARWPELVVLDWNAASSHAGAARWFSDGVHLTATGRAEFALFLRDAVVTILSDGYVPPRPLAPDVPLRVKVTGVAGVPENAAGVALNVTAVRTSAWGFLTVWPCGSPKPTTSAVNFQRPGSVEPNAVVVPVDGTGEVCVSSSVATDLLVDVASWFDAGVRGASGELRLVDTRVGTGGTRVVAEQVLKVPVTGVAGVPQGAAGVALNVTALRTSGWGFLTVWPCGSPKPETSSVNFQAAGAVEPNAVVVPVDGTGEVCVSSSVATDLLVDVAGWFESGVRGASGDLRLVDTRAGVGGTRLAAEASLRVPVTGVAGVPADAVGVALNVTALRTSGWGFLTVWPCGSPKPATSSVNFQAAGAVEPNAVVVPVDGTGEVCVSSSVATDLLVDVAGWFDGGIRAGAGELRLVDTRIGKGSR